jgi:DeoR family fructose operon transcriptional repressor
MRREENPLPASRRAEIVELVRRQGQVTVTELAAAFGVSSDTIRRDLDYLQDQGALGRAHGGAVILERKPASSDPSYSERESRQVAAKARIAKAAAELIADGETVLFNPGTTTLAVAKTLASHRDLTIVTNNLQIPSAVDRASARAIYVLGGVFSTESWATIGTLGFAGGRGMSADKAVLGVGGVSDGAGLSLTNLAEGQLLWEMIKAAKTTIIVASSDKFGRDAFFHAAPLSAVDLLVTDDHPPADLQNALDEAGVRVIIAG